MNAIELRQQYESIKDKRHKPFVEHKLADVLILTQCAVMCGFQRLEEISEYGRSKLDWLKSTFGITKIPSDSTLCRILSLVNAETVINIVVDTMRRQLGIGGEQIALDGKTICSTATEATKQDKLHIVTMYMTETGVILGQKAVSEKTNEIPVVRELLSLFSLAGKVVTADAMHCNRETAELIIRQGGDYVLALKGNQGTTHEEIAQYMDMCISDRAVAAKSACTQEKNRGRLEKRTCWQAPELDWFDGKKEWVGLKSAYAVRRKITVNDKTTEETEYYISSLDASPEKILKIVRNHWKIEAMHWMLDVVFGEDDSQLQNANAHQTLNIFRKNAIASHQNYIASLPQKTKPAVKTHMLRTALNDNLLLDVLLFEPNTDNGSYIDNH